MIQQFQCTAIEKYLMDSNDALLKSFIELTNYVNDLDLTLKELNSRIDK